METKRNVKFFIAPPISIPMIIGLVILAVSIFFVCFEDSRLGGIIGIIVALMVLVFSSGSKSDETDIDYQAQQLTKDLQEESMKKFDVYEKNFLKMMKPIDFTGFDFEPEEEVVYFKKGKDGTPRTNYFASYNLIFTGEKMYLYGKRVSLTDEEINQTITGAYKYTELDHAELLEKTYTPAKGEPVTYYVFKIVDKNGNAVLDTCINYGADADKALADINRAIVVRTEELKKKAEEKAIKLKEFREKVMAGEADLPADEGFI